MSTPTTDRPILKLGTLSTQTPIRLSKAVMQLVGCSRTQAEQYIEGGWVRVDGLVVEEPYFKVTSQAITLDNNASLTPIEPVSLLFHKPAGLDMEAFLDREGLTLDNHWVSGATKTELRKKHFRSQLALLPLETQASGLVLLSQDPRIIRKVAMDAERIEQEFSVEINRLLTQIEIRTLQTGTTRAHSPLKYKVSWQNETHLRFAIKGAEPGQIAHLCSLVQVEVLSLKRLRLGRIPLSSLPIGYWRYAAQWERI